MTAPSLQPKNLVPAWLRALNATLTAWNTFIAAFAVLIIVFSFIPSLLEGLAGTPVVLLMILSVATLTATAATRWQVRRMKLSARRTHIWLLAVLLIVTCLTLPSPFVFMIPQ